MDKTLRLGDLEVVPLLDGVFDLEGAFDEKFAIPEGTDLTPFRERHPALFTDLGWRLHVRCALIRIGDRRMLVDTGVGHEAAPAFAWVGIPGRMQEELATAGVRPTEVDTVVLTHVHDDHIGGTVTPQGAPAFPNARYVLQRADRDQQLRWAAEDEEDRAIWETLLAPLVAGGRLELVDGETSLNDGITLVPAPGHTPGHQMVELRGGGTRLLISADTVNHPMQLAHPTWASASDSDPEMATRTRVAVIDQLIGSETVLAPSHFDEAFGHVVADEDGRATWEPLWVGEGG
jgi:glyoxylase-like metal-dependent hydrolase (beta-lactamase superfamily II)